MCVRLISGSCDARKRSKRWPASAAETVNAFFEEVFTEARGRKRSEERSFAHCVRSGYRSRSERYSSCRRKRCRTSQPSPPKKCAGQDHPNAHKLHQRHLIVKHQCAARIAAEELEDAALHSIQRQIGAENLAGEPLPRT